MVKKRLLNLTVLSGLLAIMVLLGGCAGLTGDGADTESSFATSIWPMLIFIVILFGLMYFLMIRPQRRKQKEHQDLVEQLHRGDRVVPRGESTGRSSPLVRTVSS